MIPAQQMQRRVVQQIVRHAVRRVGTTDNVAVHHLRCFSAVANLPRGPPPMAHFHARQQQARPFGPFLLGGVGPDANEVNDTNEASGSSGLTVSLNCTPTCCGEEDDDGG